STPLHRLYDPNGGAHYFTANDTERDLLVSLGWNFEGDEGAIYTSPVEGTAEVFHLYNRLTGSHFYTQSSAKRDELLSLADGPWVQHASLGFAPTAAGGATPANTQSSTATSVVVAFLHGSPSPGRPGIGFGTLTWTD